MRPRFGEAARIREAPGPQLARASLLADEGTPWKSRVISSETSPELHEGTALCRSPHCCWRSPSVPPGVAPDLPGEAIE